METSTMSTKGAPGNQGAIIKLGRSTVISAGALLFLGGWLLSFAADPFLPSAVSKTKTGYKAGYSDAKSLVEQSAVGRMFQTSDDVRTLSGVVVSTSSNTITLRVGSMNPFDDPDLAERLIVVGSSTTISRLEPKDPRVFQSDMYAYVNSAPSSKGKPPLPYTTKSGSLADIEIGSPLTVTASVNIKTLKSFSPEHIDIQYRSKANYGASSTTKNASSTQ